MKRRTDCSKFRRPIKKSKIAEGLSSNTLLYMKFLILWAIVITADFLVEFRFEFLWPFWLLLRSVHDSFKYKGLAFSILFVCIAFTSDLICLFFIPAQWLFFVASTYVWVQFVWHTDRGVCLPTIILWVIFVYLEAAIRWKDSRNMPHLDLCRPFAAHCIGYPVVTLGFGFKSYVGYRIRQRKQREVAKENDFYMQLLQQALPQEEAPPVLSQSDQQLQPQEKDPIVIATGNHHSSPTSSSSNNNINNSHQNNIKNAQNNSNKLLHNNSTNSSSPSMTNGHAIGVAASLLFGLSSSMSMTSSSNSNTNSSTSSSSATSSVISNGVGYNHSTQQVSSPSSSSNSNSSSSSMRNRKIADNKESSGLMTSLNSGGGSKSISTNNIQHHPNNTSLNNNNSKDHESPIENLGSSYDFSTSTTKNHDKDSPKQHYQLSNSKTNTLTSNYDDVFGKSSEHTKKSSKPLQQNGNLQHYQAKQQDNELQQQSMCQQQSTPEQMTTRDDATNITISSNEKERTKSGRKGRGNKGNKNSATETTTVTNSASNSSSSSKDNHQMTSFTTTTNSHHLNSSTNSNNHNNTQHHHDVLPQSQYIMCNNKDHMNSKPCEFCPKMEMEVKKLKLEINLLKQNENELRHKNENNASNIKSCLQAKQKENDELHTKLQEINSLRQVERQTIQNMERRLTEERRLRQSLEAQLNNERKYRKQAEEKAARSECTDSCRMKKQQLESDVNKIRREYAAFEEMKHNVEKQTQRYEQELRKMEVELRNREQQQHSDLITLNDLRMKNATLEKNLSAETRVKLDLFSALGESKRDIEMRDTLLRDRNNELLDLKAKIAQLLAVMPSMPDSFGFPTSMHHEVSGIQSPVQQQQQSVSPLGHLVLGSAGGGNGIGQSSLVLDPNAKTYTPKNTSSLIGGAEA